MHACRRSGSVLELNDRKRNEAICAVYTIFNLLSSRGTYVINDHIYINSNHKRDTRTVDNETYLLKPRDKFLLKILSFYSSMIIHYYKVYRERVRGNAFHISVALISNCRWLMAIICYVLQNTATSKQELHTFLSKDELRRYLHADSHEKG